ncbi:Membrane protein [Candidatus Nitrotoga sp. HW29]|uniref:NAD(P)/FAD-dependent oxidoreductase n=1 Tax=Candidatus Nitrotoga sp. HW29 TaxID=2886963 RepID=UPI001EF18C8D|nr:NAD(P)/FAD-dependent oxidoreductase [Candidatus Nitrotoga sp. HW29]CAH1906315.1 Membrane protein [Candidatus Nitrotoga sp. HW29]
MSINVDVLIVGAGAAGMMCAIEAARRGRSVQLLDHSNKLAEKIRISGGGRCNFTNLYAKSENYLSGNPHFCRSALARYTPQHFITWLNQQGIAYHEKKLGQLFCDEGSSVIIAMLKNECDAAGVRWLMSCKVHEVAHFNSAFPQAGEGVKIKNTMHPSAERFSCNTNHGIFRAQSLVIASGGLSIPKIGATPFGYQVAQQFDIPVTKLKPGLVPLSFHPDDWAPYVDLAGISVDAIVSYGKHVFRENLLFTHRGLSGPAILQISSYWEPGQPLHINLLPDHDTLKLFAQQRDSHVLLNNFFAQYLPKRFIETWCAQLAGNKLSGNMPINQYSNKEIAALAAKLHNWQITPSGTLGYTKAEVTCGGVDTHALSSKTMEANQVNGLYFIGEVVDVTGQLGGYNFQWAWSSGYAAGQYC